MEEESGQLPAKSKSLLDVFVGIETGVLGGILMLLWFALIAPLADVGWWLAPNLLATSFFGYPRVLSGPGLPTVVGASVHLLGAGIVGAINGLLTPGGRLFGLFIAAGWYLLCYLFAWKRIAPGMFVYFSQPVLIIAYFLYGSMLGWHGHLAERARR